MISPRVAPVLSPSMAPDLVEVVQRHFAASIAATRPFFAAHAAAIASLCQRMAVRFEQGGTLLVFGEGPQASDARHVSVEFVHPVIVGKRALPAIALTADPRATVGALGAPTDIALALCASTPSQSVLSALDQARDQGMLTILLAADAAGSPHADVCFVVPGADPLVVQEVHETVYHVLWELVHVFLEDRPAVSSAARVDGPTTALTSIERQLYPFLFEAGEPRPDRAQSLLRDVSQSTRQKCEDVCHLRAQVLARSARDIADGARAMAARLARGGRLLAFGNGGSATDAQDAAVDCLAPPFTHWRRLSALALSDDIGVVTGVANDVGFDHVFSRQILAFGRPQDVALGFSTSGTSRSVIDGLDVAKRRGLLTIALTGCDGGALATAKSVDCCVVAGSDYVPRIQEAHATVWHALLSAVHAELSHPGARGGAA